LKTRLVSNLLIILAGLVAKTMEVRTEKAQAEFKNGVLKVVIPKKEEAKTEKVKVTVH
jgi:hypothetical protein